MAYAGNTLYIPVSEVDEIIGTGTSQFNSIRLYSSSERGGTYDLVTTITLVAGDTVYTYEHTTGVSSTWYKITFYNSFSGNETELTESEPFRATRDRLTLKELRQKIIRNLAGKAPLTATSITAQVVTIPSLIDTAADSEYYEGWHLYRPDSATEADNDRRVSGYTVATGALTHGGLAYADTTATSEEIEISPLDIDYNVLLEKISDGLLDTRWLYRFEIGMISGQTSYNLPGFVEGEEYVKQIWRRHGGTANSYVWRPIGLGGQWANVRSSNFVCILDVDPSFGDNEVLAIEVWRPGEALEGETDFTNVQRKWAEAAAMVECLTFIINQQKIRHNKTTLGDLLQDWKATLRKNSRRYGPTPGMKVKTPMRMSGLPAV